MKKEIDLRAVYALREFAIFSESRVSLKNALISRNVCRKLRDGETWRWRERKRATETKRKAEKEGARANEIGTKIKNPPRKERIEPTKKSGRSK